MLVVIDPKSATADEKVRAINMMRAIKAVATASANSTPSALAWTDAAGTTGAEMITVIANTTAGGWTAGANDTVPASSFSTSTDTYRLDLYVQNTNSSTYPYHKFCMAPGNPVGAANLFSGNYATYPGLSVWYGAHTASAMGTSGVFWSAATNIPNVYSFKGATAGNNNGHLIPNDGAFMMACTAEYIHFVNLAGASYTSAGLTYGTNGNGAYVAGHGFREQQAWETSSVYSASIPPVSSFAVDCRGNYASSGYPAYQFAWLASLSSTGSVQAPGKFGNSHGMNGTTGGTTNVNAVTGIPLGLAESSAANYQVGLNIARAGSPDTATLRRNGTSSSLAAPLFSLAAHMGTYGGSVFVQPPITDPATGLFVPPAIPLVIQSLYMDGTYSRMNPGGKMKGIYKSLSSSNGGFSMSSFISLNQTYTINGEDYYPALTGREATTNSGADLFLLRKT